MLAAPRVNRYEKRAKDAVEWLPAQDRCWFAGQVVLVRVKYGLTVDRRERAALEKILTDYAKGPSTRWASSSSRRSRACS